MKNTPELTRSMVLVLMVLAKCPAHGYAIMTEIERVTDGDYVVSAGTLYRSLSVMQSRELVQAAPDLRDPSDDARRQHYRITQSGRSALADELARMEKLLQVARS